MPDLRKDPVVGRWVIVAQGRSRRPYDFDTSVRRRSSGVCPFCEGHESMTPGEIAAYRHPESERDREGWRVRVIPNKFPALESDGDPRRRREGIYDAMCGVGAHEVIIESPQHVVSTSQLSLDQMSDVLAVYRDRLVDLKKDPRLAYGLIFKNVGAAAGASLEHAHSQLIATPIVPVNVWEEMTGSLEFFSRQGRCVYCAMIEQELSDARRIVLDAPGFVAFCPFASRFAYETWIVPKVHAGHYESIDNDGIRELADVVKRTIGKIELGLDLPAYNCVIHTAPFDTHEVAHYHWHIEVMPSVSKAAGYEWGAGFYINSVSPEEAAVRLRAAGM
jgi:UDPglucose--hexose-1-phosphate uridylyltransferase